MTTEVGRSGQNRRRGAPQDAELESVHKTLLRSEKMASVASWPPPWRTRSTIRCRILTYAHLVLRGLLKHEFAERDEMADQLRTIERESKRCGTW